MKQKRVVHFGAGALGRGLVVPLLHDSGCSIILADTNPSLLSVIREQHGYYLDISDADEDRIRNIPIEDIVSPIDDERKLINYLRDVTAVTTSVRRENLKHVARVLAKAWGEEMNEERMVLCCENVEHVGVFFKKLLLEHAQTSQERENLDAIRIPDTIVDRICASGDTIDLVTSEQFHECSVDQRVVKDTGITLIPAVADITSHFYRKRYLLNTYADTISFLGKGRGFSYVYEVAQHTGINEEVEPYLELLKLLLYKKYDISREECDTWSSTYRKRLSNANIPRKLGTVARNLWAKLTLEERFLCPLVELMRLDIDIKPGLVVIHKILAEANKEECLTVAQLREQLEAIWCINDEGKDIYHLYKRLFL